MYGYVQTKGAINYFVMPAHMVLVGSPHNPGGVLNKKGSGEIAFEKLEWIMI